MSGEEKSSAHLVIYSRGETFPAVQGIVYGSKSVLRELQKVLEEDSLLRGAILPLELEGSEIHPLADIVSRIRGL